MADTTISLRIDRSTYEKMRRIDHINWSAVIRKMLVERIKEEEERFDYEKAKQASEIIGKIQKSGVFNKGKSSVEIIREWRNKRK